MVSGLGERTPAKTRKDAKAHAAREAHAKERRLRMQHFHQTQGHREGYAGNGGREAYDEPDVELLPGPLDVLASHHADPFSATVKPLTAQEKFLFRHCE